MNRYHGPRMTDHKREDQHGGTARRLPGRSAGGAFPIAPLREHSPTGVSGPHHLVG
jgi:hypothetical protein